jgi:glycosyltransferase involved in cell wall biosynthesis
MHKKRDGIKQKDTKAEKLRSMTTRFNYIVPIFNKEDILPDTLEGIEKCASSESRIVMIVDGCTDRSEAIVDDFMRNSSHQTEKILMPNVHMLLSVNAGLKTVTDGFSVIMQDDIVLQDPETELKIINLYEEMEGKLGVISFRYGADLRASSLRASLGNAFYSNIQNYLPIKERVSIFGRMIETENIIKSPDDNEEYPVGEYNKFYQRMCAINGPNVIPWEVFSRVGLLDEKIAPYGYDDPDYSLRGLKEGFINGLFPVKYLSEDGWSGSSRSKEFKKNANRIINRSRVYVWRKHAKFISDYVKSRTN